MELMKQLSCLNVKLIMNRNVKFVYRILKLNEWNQFKKKKIFYGNANDIDSGFIHLSTQEQVDDTVKIYFKDCKEVVVLKLDFSEINGSLRWEKSRNDIFFPHLYNHICISNVKNFKIINV